MRTVVMGVLLTVCCMSAAWRAQAMTDEQKCFAGRLKAKSRYEKCMNDWLRKHYAGVGWDATKFPKCRIAYGDAWAKLQAKLPGTSCDQPRFEDNGDGTITDHLTTLVWEKKGDAGGLHDKDAEYSWSVGPPHTADGTAFTAFVSGLNGAGFAGAHDWRMPTFAELHTILLPEPYPCSTAKCIAAAFDDDCTPGCDVTACSCSDVYYWSATTVASLPVQAWHVAFDDDTLALEAFKESPFKVRAVRGGF